MAESALESMLANEWNLKPKKSMSKDVYGPSPAKDNVSEMVKTKMAMDDKPMMSVETQPEKVGKELSARRNIRNLKADQPKANKSSFNMKAAGAGALQSVAGGGDASDAASAGLMASGHPYAMAAGFALKAMSEARKKKEARQLAMEKARYSEEIRGRESMQNALVNMQRAASMIRAA
jgi:hypothetical protein